MQEIVNYGKMCPNPVFERKDYVFLTGEWRFSFSPSEEEPVFDRKIVVPYSYECEASGIGDGTMHECVWYERELEIKPHDGRIHLCFEGVDYHCFVYVNGGFACEHRGGYTSFFADITELVKAGTNTLRVKVLDDFSGAQLRGKQRRKSSNYDCWYIQTTGIWKPVWLEYCGSNPLKRIFFSPENDGTVCFEGETEYEAQAEIEIFEEGKSICTQRLETVSKLLSGKVKLNNPRLWDIENPFLYEVKIRVFGESTDEVSTYFAFREVNTDENGVYINGKKVYLRMILAQGYWKNTMLTAPDETALEKDILLAKKLGFNGIRMHQKVESNVFYYLCDKLGMYVWGEIPSAYEYTDRMKREFGEDCLKIVRQLKVYPCIIAWVIFNESWGIPEIKNNRECQLFVEAIQRKVRAEDPTRLIVINDGWHQLNGDLLTLHEYEQNAETLLKEYRDKNYVVGEKLINQNRWGKSFADNYTYSHQAVIISEFGGVAMVRDDGWGYGDKASDLEEYRVRVTGLVSALKRIDYLAGFCYTQLTDVQQETNGLLTIERKPKLPLECIRNIFAFERNV
jgi:putative hydrolase